MSLISSAFNQRSYLIPSINLTSIEQQLLVSEILKKHSELNIKSIKLIDENDDYDSFLVENEYGGYCVKISFDPLVIFYDYMAITGINHLKIAPLALDRGEIEYGKTIYYSIQTFEYSFNLKELGSSLILDKNHKSLHDTLTTLHSYEIPTDVYNHLDDIKTYLEFHKVNFSSILSYVSESEELDFTFVREIYEKIYNEMMNFTNSNFDIIDDIHLVHGNLNSSTIIYNSNRFQFINFENCFKGNFLFDILNLTFECEATGLNEFNFVSNRIKAIKNTESRFKCKANLEKYKLCKYIWIRKKLLDLIKDYTKEVIILDKARPKKILNLSNEFFKHFYKFSTIETFDVYKDFFIEKLSALVLK